MQTKFFTKNDDYFNYKEESNFDNWSFFDKPKSNLLLYIVTFLLTILITIIFTGCSKPDIDTQKKQCLDQKKEFLIKKVLNLRTGEYILKGECK